jgi:thioredoxin 1
MVKELTADTFKETISGQVPVLVDFWAVWCQPCRMMAPVVDSIAEEYDGRVLVCKLNIDDYGSIAAEYGIMSIPTLMLFKEGQPVERLVGVRPKEVLAETLDKNL